MSAQARHTKKPIQRIEKLGKNPLPCRKSLRITTTPRRSMAEETCSLMEGSRRERDTSSSSSDNPSSESSNPSRESKRTNNKVRIQTKVGDAQAASSTTKKMLKLHRQQQRRCSSCIVNNKEDAQAASSTTKKMPKLTPSKRMPFKSPEQVGSPHKPHHCVS